MPGPTNDASFKQENNGSIYEDQCLSKNQANFVPLTPLSLLKRTASVYPDRTAIIHQDIRRTWSETYERCVKLSAALVNKGIGKGDTVSIMAPNVPEFVEASFGVPMSGAVLNSLNIRLDADVIAYILNHSETKLILVDREFSKVIQDAVSKLSTKPVIIDIDDKYAQGGELIGEMTYDQFLDTGEDGYSYDMPSDEWQAISLNYTSGTTGDPKGVVYSHRGAYLNAIGNATAWALPHFPVYLWTLPMFHCNGWCFPWTITAMAGTHVCLRNVTAEGIFQAIEENRITHMCGAPIVMSFMVNAPEESKPKLDYKISMMTAGAPPPASVIGNIEKMGIDVVHVYGLTEVYGPTIICAWNPDWDDLPADERAKLKARQGVPYEMQEGLMIADPETMQPVPKDGSTIGEIMIRGNIVMKGYLKDPDTTESAFKGGWFHSGDLAVMHPNGYAEIKDRSKDIIISGGENISSVEVEDILYRHDAVQAVAVVAKPDEKWGETPCAFVELKPGMTATEEEIINFCRNTLAKYKCPKNVIFSELPKTSTGKIQKFVLRERAKEI